MKIDRYLNIRLAGRAGFHTDHPSIHLRNHHGGKEIQFPMGEGGNVAMFVLRQCLHECTLEEAAELLGGKIIYALGERANHTIDILILPDGAPVKRESASKISFNGGWYDNIHP